MVHYPSEALSNLTRTLVGREIILSLSRAEDKDSGTKPQHRPNTNEAPFGFPGKSFYPIIHPPICCKEQRVGGRAHAGNAKASGRHLQQCREVNAMKELSTMISSIRSDINIRQ